MSRQHPVQREKAEQAAIVELAQTFGGLVWVLGTRRGRGKPCPKCGTFVAEHQGLRQTPGHPDLEIYLPTPAPLAPRVNPSSRGRRLLFWESKAPGGRPSDEQTAYAELARAAGIDHGMGTFDDFVSWAIAEGYCREIQPPFPLPREAHA